MIRLAVRNRLADWLLQNRLDVATNRLDVANNRLDVVKNRLAVVKDRLDVMQNRLAVVKKRLAVAKNRLDVANNQRPHWKRRAHSYRAWARNTRNAVRSSPNTRKRHLPARRRCHAAYLTIRYPRISCRAAWRQLLALGQNGSRRGQCIMYTIYVDSFFYLKQPA